MAAAGKAALQENQRSGIEARKRKRHRGVRVSWRRR